MFRRLNRKGLPAWGFLCSLALLFVQGVGLHIHTLDHDSEYQNHLHSAEVSESHLHTSSLHFSTDLTHDEHHDGSVTEVDFSLDGLFKDIKNIFSIALLVFILVLALLFVWRAPSGWYICIQSYLNLYRLAPPLRAPPQSC